jgi:hypothetical protein
VFTFGFWIVVTLTEISSCWSARARSKVTIPIALFAGTDIVVFGVGSTR